MKISQSETCKSPLSWSYQLYSYSRACKQLYEQAFSLTLLHMQPHMSQRKRFGFSPPIENLPSKLFFFKQQKHIVSSLTRKFQTRLKVENELIPAGASLAWEKGGTPAEPRVVYPELLSDCCLMEQCVCVSYRERMCVCVADRGRGSHYPPLPPPPRDSASLTGWRGRWGHCNKQTQAHTFFYACYVLLFPHSFPPPHFPLSDRDLLSPFQALAPLASCFSLNLSAGFLPFPFAFSALTP